MNGLTHLRSLPAYVINMDRSVDRWASVPALVAPYVGAVTRVPAVDGSDIPEPDVLEFIEMANLVTDLNPELRITPRKTMRYWRGSMGCYLSHLRAIETALLVGHERFLILEDDARFRTDLAERTPVPAEPGVHVWGGALLGGSYTTHARRAATEPDTNPWKQIPQEPAKVRNRYQTTAMEMDAVSAEEWLSVCKRHPQAYDSSWWLAMLAVPTFVPAVEVIYQDLTIGSERSPSAGAARIRASKRLL